MAAQLDLAHSTQSPQASNRAPSRPFATKIQVESTFCPPDVADVFDTTEWDLRTAQIKGENGELLFEQHDCEVPAKWSQLATNVVVSKYFYGEINTPERETSVRQLVHRVSRTIADWGTEDGYFASAEDGERFYRDLAWLCLHQHGAFNSPVWFNVGLYHQYDVRGDKCNWRWSEEKQDVIQPENPYEFPQGSACFIQRVSDNMEDIMRLATSEAMLFKFGSGTGTDLSTLRSHTERLSGGGKPSGPLSFMRVYDQIAAVVKSGGKTRRAAKMQSLKVWHPDIMEFIECKWKEERKARVLIEQGGYESNFNGEAYSSIMFQNANLSVRVTDDFMQAALEDREWTTHWVTDANTAGPTYRAKEIMDRMADCAWHCGDPGVQYDTTINRWHTCPNSGRINASNPCVTGDTLVATAEGLRRIEDLVGKSVDIINDDGNRVRVNSVFKTGTKEVYELRTCSGYRLRLTADHRVLTVEGIDIAAEELQQGDKLVLGRVECGTRRLDSQSAYELGACLARDESTIAWAEKRGIKHLHQEHDLETADGSVLVMPIVDVTQFDRVTFNELLRGFCETRPPEASPVVNFPSAVSLELTHPSKEVLSQFQLLLLGSGIKSWLGNHPFDARHLDEVVGEASFLKIDPSSVARFRQVLRGEDIAPGTRVLWDAFESLELIGVVDVYDLTEPVSHHFVANGIVVHNCSEYMFLDDTACNLASINLMKFRLEDGAFDVERFKAACRIFFIAQEILVDHASYPTPDIARNSHLFRPLGLGYSNLGSVIMTSGLPYDSPGARGVCGAITALLHGSANLTSAELAAAVGPFAEYEKNREPMLGVMQMHREAVEAIDPECPDDLCAAARDVWDQVLAAGNVHGFRNAQATVLAPTGTISFMMDCDTTGIEPDIALVKYKQLAGGGMLKIVNRTVPLALETLGYDEPQARAIVDHIDNEDTIEGAPDLFEEHLPVFDCAFTPRNGTRSILWHAHVGMMAAAQPFLSGAISKTVNMPRDTTPEDIAGAYIDGWKFGLKALAIYRDGSKESQPLSTSTEADKAKAKEVTRPRREHLPDTRHSITHKFSVAGHEGYLTIGLYEDGRPGEVFITMAKEGSTVGGLMDCFGTAISMSLQYGVPLEVLVNKFSHTRFEPMGHTKNPDVRIAKSLVDYIFRWLGITFLAGYREQNLGLPPGGQETPGGGPPSGGKASGDDESEPAPTARKAGGREEVAGGRGQEAGNRGHRSEVGGQGSASAAVSSPDATAHNGRNGTNGHANGHSSDKATGNHPLPRLSARGEGATAVLDRMTPPKTVPMGAASRDDQFAAFQSDAPSCDSCGAITVRSGNCYLCYNCGASMGCS